MLDSFFYAAKPRLSEEPRPMQTLHSSHPSLGAASRLSLSSLGRCTQQVSLHTCLSLAPSATEICAKNQPSSQATPSLIFYLISTCKLCSRPGLLDFSRRKRLPQSQPSLTPLSLSSLGRFAALSRCPYTPASRLLAPSASKQTLHSIRSDSSSQDLHSFEFVKPRSLRFARSLGQKKSALALEQRSNHSLDFWPKERTLYRKILIEIFISFRFITRSFDRLDRRRRRLLLLNASSLPGDSTTRYLISLKRKVRLTAIDGPGNLHSPLTWFIHCYTRLSRCSSLRFAITSPAKSRLISYKRKGLESQRRLSDLPRPRWGTSHLRASHGRASLVTLKRKGRMSHRRYRNLHATCCILQHLQQSCCRTLPLVPLKRKGRLLTAIDGPGNLRTLHRHPVVAQALLCRCGSSYLISHVLKRKDCLTEIDGIKICVEKILWSPPYFSLSFELQEFTRCFFLLDFVQKKRPSNSNRRSRKSAHSTDICSAPSLVVAGSSSLTRYEDALSCLISHALKRRERKKYSLRKDESRGRQSLHCVFVSDAVRSIDRRRRRLLLLHSSLPPIPLLDLFGFGHAEPASRKVRIRPFPSLAPLSLVPLSLHSTLFYSCTAFWVWFLSLPSLGLRSFRLVLLLRFAPLLPAVWLPWTLRPWWSFRVALPVWIQ